MLGATNTSISMYELGQRQLTPNLIAQFCALYHVSADYLLGLSDVRAPGTASAGERPADEPAVDAQAAEQTNTQVPDVQAMAEMISRFSPEQTELFLQVLAILRRGQDGAGK